MMAHNIVAIWFSDQRHRPGVLVKRRGTKLAQDYSIFKPLLKSFQSVGRKCENIIIIVVLNIENFVIHIQVFLIENSQVFVTCS